MTRIVPLFGQVGSQMTVYYDFRRRHSNVTWEVPPPPSSGIAVGVNRETLPLSRGRRNRRGNLSTVGAVVDRFPLASYFFSREGGADKNYLIVIARV